MPILDLLSDAFEQFQHLSISCDVNSLVTFFENIVKVCIQRFVPLKTKKQNHSMPWITRDILHLSRRVARLRVSKRNGNPELLQQFSDAKEELRAKVHSGKDFYYRNSLPQLMKHNPRKFWASILPQSTSPNTFIIDDKPVCDSLAIATSFNTYFQSVFTTDNLEMITFPSNSQCSVDDISISVEGVLNLILNINVKKSSGPDDIPNVFLHRYSLWTSRYLTTIFQKSLSSATVPVAWKLAKVIPLFKAGSTQILSNYRPISLTSHSCKLLEHIIHKHITEFLEANNILCKFQHGFRRGSVPFHNL